MPDIDEFATMLLEQAKRFAELSKNTKDADRKNACLNAALMLGFCSLEAHLNAVADELSMVPDLSPHEKAILKEMDVKIKSGVFLADGKKIYRLEDRLDFIIRKFSGKPIDKNSGWWPGLQGSITLRNELTHPKSVPIITYERVRQALQSIISTLDALYRAAYKKPFPTVALGLDSSLNF